MATVRPKGAKPHARKATPAAKTGAHRLKISARKVKAGAHRLTAKAHKATAGAHRITSTGARKATASARRFTASARKAKVASPRFKVTAHKTAKPAHKAKAPIRHSWLYELRSGGQVVYYGVAGTREPGSIKRSNASKAFTQVKVLSLALTRASAMKRETEQVKMFQKRNGGRPPKYNTRIPVAA
jgi:hypothetical protein